MSYAFGKRSNKKKNTCHPYLIKILDLAISRTVIDFGITEGHRSIARQHELFIQGKSKIDGVTKEGKHNKNPSLAADIYSYHPDIKWRRKIAYDKIHLAVIAGTIMSCAKELKEKGEIKCDIRWGADWNRNGIVDMDQSFDDYPHFELINII